MFARTAYSSTAYTAALWWRALLSISCSLAGQVRASSAVPAFAHR